MQGVHGPHPFMWADPADDGRLKIRACPGCTAEQAAVIELLDAALAQLHDQGGVSITTGTGMAAVLNEVVAADVGGPEDGTLTTFCGLPIETSETVPAGAWMLTGPRGLIKSGQIAGTAVVVRPAMTLGMHNLIQVQYPTWEQALAFYDWLGGPGLALYTDRAEGHVSVRADDLKALLGAIDEDCLHTSGAGLGERIERLHAAVPDETPAEAGEEHS